MEGIKNQFFSTDVYEGPYSEEDNFTFYDLFNLEEIQNIQDSFSAATGVASIITEVDGRPITKPSGFCHFCNEIIRKSEKGSKNCMISDSIIGSPKADGPRIQRCFSGGLLDAGASIVVGGKHIANWLIGQVLDDEYNTDDLLPYADEIGVERSELVEALKKVRRMPRQQFVEISNFLFLTVRQLSRLAFKNIIQEKEIKRRRTAEASLAEEKELFRVTLHSIGDAVITTDNEGNVKILNEVAETLTGWKKEDAVGIPLEKVFNIINEKTRKRCQNPAEKILKTGKTIALANHTALISKDGTERSIADSGAPIKDDHGKVHGAVLVFRDVTEEKRKLEEILYLSYYDKLTGLYNRAFLEKKIEEIENKKEYPVSVIIGDANGLKLANDIFGHLEGDKLLTTISEVLRKSCRKEDIIARWGGDEFLIILPKTDYNNALKVFNLIQNGCKDFKECKIRPSIALGVATKEDEPQSILNIVKDAEDRMYRNKLLERKSKYSGILLSLQRTLFEKSYETEEHALRLVNLSYEIGKELNLPENDMDDLKLLAMLHDIGKIAIPDNILTKPGKFSPDEWEQMKKHSEVGFRIAQSALELSHIAEYILYHHERWDGKGYPQGISGDSIPLLSRIISVVDSYDVMTHIRPYKDKLQKEVALEEIRKNSGTQFDPHIAEVLINIMSKN